MFDWVIDPVRVWISVVIIKTFIGYLQLPSIARVMKRQRERQLGAGELLQLVLLSPLVLTVAWPYFLYKERYEFFYLYSEADVEEKLKEMGHI